jgi:hypothetical protein
MAWIKFEKDLQIDPRVLRMAKALDRRMTVFGPGVDEFDPCNAMALPAVTLVCGALVRLWCLADSHVGDDDVLDLSASDVDEFLGIPGFCELMPADWLIADGDRVKLPGFQAHNGSAAKKRAVTQKRVAAHRSRNAASVTRLDQTRPDQTRPENSTAAAPPNAGPDPDWFVEFRGQYPKRSGDPNWRGALRAAQARIQEGHQPQEFVDGARRYAKFLAATGKLGTEYVQQASRFLGPSKPFALPWDPPVSAGPTAGSAQLSAVDRVRQATGVDLRALTGARNG